MPSDTRKAEIWSSSIERPKGSTTAYQPSRQSWSPSKVDVLVTSSTPGARAAKQATTKIPVVVAIVGDAVAVGIVPSLARQGGNITGLSFHFPELMAKRIELLREIPGLTRIAAIFNPANPVAAPGLKAIEATARALNVELQPVAIRGPQDFEVALTMLAQRRSDAFVVVDDPMLRSQGGGPLPS